MLDTAVPFHDHLHSNTPRTAVSGPWILRFASIRDIKRNRRWKMSEWTAYLAGFSTPNAYMTKVMKSSTAKTPPAIALFFTHLDQRSDQRLLWIVSFCPRRSQRCFTLALFLRSPIRIHMLTVTSRKQQAWVLKTDRCLLPFLLFLDFVILKHAYRSSPSMNLVRLFNTNKKSPNASQPRIHCLSRLYDFFEFLSYLWLPDEIASSYCCPSYRHVQTCEDMNYMIQGRGSVKKRFFGTGRSAHCVSRT